MILIDDAEMLYQKLLDNLRQTYSAKSNSQLIEACRWLKENHAKLQDGFARVLCSPNQYAVQQAVCTHLSNLWQERIDEHALQYGVRILLDERLNLKPARQFCKCFRKVVKELTLDEKRNLLNQVFLTLQNNRSMTRFANLLSLVTVTIECFDSFNLMGVYEQYYPKLLQCSANVSVKLMEQLHLVLRTLSQEDFQQRQMTELELLLQCSKECVSQVIVFLEKANEQEETYRQMLSQLHNNRLFEEVVVRMVSINAPEVMGVVWVSPLKQAVMLNEIKSHLMRVINEVYPKPLELLFQQVLATVLEHNNRATCPFVRSVLFDCMVMLQKWIESPQKYATFNKFRFLLMYCLMKYCIANKQEYDDMENLPQVFVEMSIRCCDQDLSPDQEVEMELKEKALSVLLKLAHYQDGMLSRLSQTLLIMLDTSLIRINQQHGRYQSFQEEFEREGFSVEAVSSTQRVETCLLILAALSHQLSFRHELKGPLYELVQHRCVQIEQLAPICANRLVLFTSRYPILCCVRLFPNIVGKGHPATKLQVAEALSCILRHTPKAETHSELSSITLQVISRISCLDKAFELVLERHFYIVDQQEGRLHMLRRLIRELQINYQHRPESLLANVNRLSLMICHFLQKVKEPSTYQPQLEKVFSLVQQIPDCQQPIIEIAVAYLDRCQHVTNSQRKFLVAGFQLIERNNFVLNSCFQLLYRQLLYNKYLDDRHVVACIIRSCLERATVEADIWELGQLYELYILTQEHMDQSVHALIKTVCLALRKSDTSVNVQGVLVEVYLCLLYKYKEQAVVQLESIIEELLEKVKNTHLTIHATLLKRVHCAYLLETVEVLAKVGHSQTMPLFNIVIHQMEGLLPQRSMAVEQTTDAYYQTCLNQKLKDLECKHPLRDLDIFELLEQKWQNLRRLDSNIHEHPQLPRQLLSRLLSSRMIEDHIIRKVVRLKR